MLRFSTKSPIISTRTEPAGFNASSTSREPRVRPWPTARYFGSDLLDDAIGLFGKLEHEGVRLAANDRNLVRLAKELRTTLEPPRATSVEVNRLREHLYEAQLLLDAFVFDDEATTNARNEAAAISSQLQSDD